ncbi:MAG: hypothetical protein FWF85_01075 [Clostridiales bacterium]|jgi:stage III sporulation protein AG|nr:hypothetical protein [Clostridiales bacterium]
MSWLNKVKSPEEDGKKERWKLSKKEKSLFIKLAAILVAGLILMQLASAWGNGKVDDVSQPAPDVFSPQEEIISIGEAGLEQKLEEILSKIKGAGEVRVLITFKQSASSEYAYNQEESKNGQDERQSRELVTGSGGPYLLYQEAPGVQGVLVVAAGAGDTVVRQQLFQAVAGILDVPAHRIVIAESAPVEQK